MKHLVIILFFCSSISFGQKTYNSTHIIHFPSENREEISSTITFNNGHILIKKYRGEENVYKQLFIITKETEELYNNGWAISYHSVTSDDKIPYILRMNKENPEAITVIKPSTDDEVATVYNLVLENQ